MITNFVKGYFDDAAVDIMMEEDGIIPPGFSRVKLPVTYRPDRGEVAIVSARTSTLNAGIFTPIGLIDPGYEGNISAWVFNCSGINYTYKAGDRLFSVVNLVLAPVRAQYEVINTTRRGKNNVGSSGGHDGR
jgi:dUTPase